MRKKCGGPGQFVCKLPTSGSEIMFDPALWATPAAIRGGNCYSYVLGDTRQRVVKATPGAYASLHGNARYTKEMDRLDCRSLTERVLADNPQQ